MTVEFKDDWGEFGIHMGPFGFGCFGPKRFFKYSRTENSHILQVRINPEAAKEQIKVRLVKPGVLEIEWPRRSEGQEIPVE